MYVPYTAYCTISRETLPYFLLVPEYTLRTCNMHPPYALPSGRPHTRLAGRLVFVIRVILGFASRPQKNAAVFASAH